MNKKYILSLFLLSLSCFSHVNAQNENFSLKGGVNTTFVSDFDNYIQIVEDGFNIPGLYSPNNSSTIPLKSVSVEETKSQIGAVIEGEYNWNISSSDWGVSIGLGAGYYRYDTDTYVNHPQAEEIYLDDLNSDYGKTQYVTLNLRPVNVAKSFLNKALQLKLGPTFKYILYHRYNYSIITFKYNESIDDYMAQKGYFVSRGKVNRFLYGLSFIGELSIYKNLNLFIDGRYMINNLYEETESDGHIFNRGSDSSLLNITLGVGWQIYKF